MTTDSLRYAGFWPRLGSLLLDFLILMLFAGVFMLADIHYGYRLFWAYCSLPNIVFGLFYEVYLVRRFGGTPGKLIAGIRIRKLNGEPVSYREAFLRYFPNFIFGMLTSIAVILMVLHMNDAEYHALSLLKRHERMQELAPSWYKPLEIVQNFWVWGELIVLLTNQKRRALHDFIAGTVVIYASPNS